MQKLRFVNGKGDEIDLTDNVNFGVVDWAGFSECGNELQTQTVPFSDGAVFLDTLLSERELSVTVAVQDDGNLENRYELKRELIKAFNPKLGEGYLYYKNDFLEKRIKVVPSLPIFPTKNSDTGGTLKADLSFTACNPYWEDVEETVIFSENKSVELRADGDIDVSCDVIIQNENLEGNNTITIFNKVGDSFLSENVITYEQSGFQTRITSETGNKKIEGLQFKKIDITGTTSVIAWNKLIVFKTETSVGNYKYPVAYISDDDFVSYIIHRFTDQEKEGTGYGFYSAVYSEVNDCIFVTQKYDNQNFKLFIIDKEYNVYDTGKFLKGSVFAISEGYGVSFVAYNSTAQGTNDLHCTVFKNKEIVHEISIDEVYGGTIMISHIYNSDNDEKMFLVGNNSTMNEVYQSGNDWRTRNTYTGWRRFIFYSGTEYVKTQTQNDKKIIYNSSENLITTQNAGLSRTIQNELNQNFNNVFYYLHDDLSIETFGGNVVYEGIDGISRQYVKLDKIGNTSYVIFYDYSGTVAGFLHLEVIRNLIEFAENLSINIRINGTKITSNTGFFIAYRNKYIGV